MGKWLEALQRYTRRDSVTLKAAGAQTANTSGSAVILADMASMTLKLNVTAVSGTNPTLDITVEGSDDAGTTWFTLGTFAQKTGVAAETKAFLAAEQVRYRSVIGGTATPSFTYSVTGSAA